MEAACVVVAKPGVAVALIVVMGAFPATAEDGRGLRLPHEKMVGNMAVERTRQERERLAQTDPRIRARQASYR